MIPAGKLSTNITPLGESKQNKNRVFISALNVLQTYQAYKNIKWYVSDVLVFMRNFKVKHDDI